MQALCRASHPLSKALDYILEDAAQQQKEHASWIAQHANLISLREQRAKERGLAVGVLRAEAEAVDAELARIGEAISEQKRALALGDGEISRLVAGLARVK